MKRTFGLLAYRTSFNMQQLSIHLIDLILTIHSASQPKCAVSYPRLFAMDVFSVQP